MKKQILGSILFIGMSLVQLSPVYGATTPQDRQRLKKMAAVEGALGAFHAGMGVYWYYKTSQPTVECHPDVLKLHTKEQIPWSDIIGIKLEPSLLGAYCVLRLSPAGSQLINENKKLPLPMNKKPNEAYIYPGVVNVSLEELIKTFDTFKKEFKAHKKDPNRIQPKPVFYRMNRTIMWLQVFYAVLWLSVAGVSYSLASSNQ